MTTSEGKGKGGRAHAPRRGRGFFRAGETTRPQLRQAAARYGFAETDVLTRWPEVVGEALAGLCHPLKVSYGRARALGATLIVQVEGARAPEVEMSAPRIIERVNGFYGYRAISRIRITQATGLAGRAAGFAEERTPFQGPPAASDPAPAALKRAAEIAAPVENPDLRAALTRLGAYVLSRAPRPRRG